MVRHFNTSINEECNRLFATKTGEQIGNQVNDFIQPVIEIKRHSDVILVESVTNATSTTIFTTPTTKDFYITGLSLSLKKDATSQSVVSLIRGFVQGSAKILLQIQSFSLTSQLETQSINFNYPIKIDKNTALTIENSNATANVTASSIIYGYFLEVTKQ